MLDDHDFSVLFVAVSHDSTRLASVTENKIKIWNAHSGECLLTIEVADIHDSISFDPSDMYLHTNRGTFDISATSISPTASIITQPQIPQYQGLGLSADGRWITYNAENRLWLPSDYRPVRSAISGNVVAIGVSSGRVWICESDSSTL